MYFRCRLRKKSWKNPGQIYLDNQKFEKDIPVTTNWEIFLEVLSGIFSFFPFYFFNNENNSKETVVTLYNVRI